MSALIPSTYKIGLMRPDHPSSVETNSLSWHLQTRHASLPMTQTLPLSSTAKRKSCFVWSHAGLFAGVDRVKMQLQSSPVCLLDTIRLRAPFLGTAAAAPWAPLSCIGASDPKLNTSLRSDHADPKYLDPRPWHRYNLPTFPQSQISHGSPTCPPRANHPPRSPSTPCPVCTTITQPSLWPRD